MTNDVKEALLGKLVMVLSWATPEKLAAFYHFATGEHLENVECEVWSAEAEMGLRNHETTDHGPQDHGTRREKAATLTRWDAESKLPFVFRWTGRHWEVIFAGGRAFRLRNTSGARYLDYFLHNPNDPIHAFDLEVEVQPEKGEARVRDSLQPESDAQALREYRQELRRLQMERAQPVGKPEKVAGLEAEMEALKSALKGAGAADTGERAFDNERKALRVVQEQLRNGGPEECGSCGLPESLPLKPGIPKIEVQDSKFEVQRFQVQRFRAPRSTAPPPSSTSPCSSPPLSL